MYPSPYELEQTLAEFCLRRFVDAFAQARGVFITNDDQKALSLVLSRFHFDHNALEEIRAEALQFNAKSTLAGFVIQSENSDFDLIDLLESRRGTSVEDSTSMKLGPIVCIQDDDHSVFKGTVDYTQWKPGRVEFLQGSPRSFEYYVQRINTWNWRLLVDCGRSNDARVMKDWMKRTVPREARLDAIEQDRLTTQQTIHFFDQLGNRASVEPWRLTQVKRVALQRVTEENIDDNEQEVRVETQPSVLSGITQAILEGKDLRINPFIKECEEGGYRFTAMTYEFEHKSQPYVLEIRAEFKGKPKIFEVAVDRSKRRVGIGEQLEESSIPADRKILTLTQFWSYAKGTYDELLAEQL
jgi:hypothetical protein